MMTTASPAPASTKTATRPHSCMNLNLDERKLLPYQIAPAHELAKTMSCRRVGVDMSDTGLGKSYIALAVAKSLGAPVLVLSPKSVKPIWHRVAAHFGYPLSSVETYDMARRGSSGWFEKEPNEGRGKSKYNFRFTGSDQTFVIFDEAHNCSGRDTQNAGLLVACRRQGIRTLLLSATLAENPLQMKAIGYALGLHSLTDFWQWARKYDVNPMTAFGPQWQCSEEMKQRHMAKIGEQILPSKGIRLEKSKLAHLFPTNIVTADAYEMDTAKINKLYKEMEIELGVVSANREKDKQREEARYTEFESALAEWEEEDRIAKLEGVDHVDPEPEYKTAKAAIEAIRFQQEIELLKVDTFLQLSHDAIAEGNRVALFVNFTATIEAIHARASGFSVVLGGQSEQERQHEIDQFNRGDTKLIVLNNKAGGVGISLHDTVGDSPRVALISPMYSARDLLQVLGRIPRAGGKTPCVQKLIYAAGTVEEKACIRVREKLHCLQSLHDGDLSAGMPFNI